MALRGNGNGHLKGEGRNLAPRPEPPILGDRRFFLLWLTQILSQTAHYAVLFALLVRVTDLTSSSTFTSLLVVTYVIPSFAFGFFSGLLVDRRSKRRILIVSNALRAVTALGFLLGSHHVWALLTVNVAFAALGQFFTTTSAAAIPDIVPRSRLMSANSMFSLALTGTQFAGMVFLAPIMLKAFGPNTLFLTAAVIFLGSSGLARLLPSIGRSDDEEPASMNLATAGSDYMKAIRMLRSDPLTCLALVHLTLSSSLVLLFAVLVPRYMQAILDVRPDDAVLVFAPVGIGALIGLRLLPTIANKIGKTHIVVIGLLGMAVALLGMGTIQGLADILENHEALNPFAGNRIGGLSILVGLTMIFAGPLGLAYAMVNAPAQTVLHERAPEEMRGRVFAAQMVLANAVSLLPLIVAGGVADVYGVNNVILAIAMSLAIIAALSYWLEVKIRQRVVIPAILLKSPGQSRTSNTPDSASVDTSRGRK